MDTVECHYCGRDVKKAFPVVVVATVLDPDSLQPTNDHAALIRYVCGSCHDGLRGAVDYLGA